MGNMLEPFAVMLYRRHLAGESIEELARGMGIPHDRVRQRIHAAAVHSDGQEGLAGVLAIEGRSGRNP
jgi:DNA-directed RNA polymerase specialized sigma24 family protein